MVSNIQKLLLLFSPHQRGFLENSRVNKGLMKGLYMINQDVLPNSFSIFTMQNRKAKYYVRTRNYDILEDVTLMKVFQEKIVLIFPQQTLQEKSFFIW